MDAPYERNVSSKYGAPMGRHSDKPEEFTGLAKLHQVPMVDGDYDPGGAYWGGLRDNPLWCAFDDDGHEAYVRATSRRSAIEKFQGIRFKHTVTQGSR